MFIYRGWSATFGRRHDEVTVPNTGREALPYLTHMRRVFSGAITPAPLTAFVQGSPHCNWDSSAHPDCLRELDVELSRLSREWPPPRIDARGGVAVLGAGWPREFASGLALTNADVRRCYEGTWQRMTGLDKAGASVLFAALDARALYMPGAQFIVSAPVLTTLAPTVRRWLARADAQMRVTTLDDSSIVTYGDTSCCEPTQSHRTCLPWLLERLWLLFLRLTRLVDDASVHTGDTARPTAWEQNAGTASGGGGLGGGDGGGDVVQFSGHEALMWRDPHKLASLVLNTSRFDTRRAVQLPPSIELRFLVRSFDDLTEALINADAAIANASSAQLQRLSQLLSPTAFTTPPEEAMHRRICPVANSITLLFRSRSPPVPLSAVRTPPSAADMDAGRQRVRRVGCAAGEVSQWIHTLDGTAHAALLRLAYPASEGGDRAAAAAMPAANIDWADAICTVLQAQQPRACKCAQRRRR